MNIHANAQTCPHCRALIVSRVLDDHVAVPMVAQDFRVSSRTVHKWLRRFRSEGAEGLNDRSSAPASIPRRQMQPGKALQDAVMEVLHAPPAEFGFNRTTWRMRDLRQVLVLRGCVATLNSIRAVIKSAGIRWKQARIALTSKDPEYRAKLDAINGVLGKLRTDEAFFSIDELGPVAVKMRAGRSLQLPGQVCTVPQWQKSKGAFIVTAALDLARNQLVFFPSEKKNTVETIRLIDLLREQYAGYRTLYLSWDSAPWHRSERLIHHLAMINETAAQGSGPRIVVLPLPTSAQFLNVIESVFSGMARAVLHNSDYVSVGEATTAVTRYFDARNREFTANPQRAGRKIWGQEPVNPSFRESNNCKDPRWMGWPAKPTSGRAEL